MIHPNYGGCTQNNGEPKLVISWCVRELSNNCMVKWQREEMGQWGNDSAKMQLNDGVKEWGNGGVQKWGNGGERNWEKGGLKNWGNGGVTEKLFCRQEAGGRQLHAADNGGKK